MNTPIIVMEIDDNSPAEAPPFTNDVSMWNFAEDFNLATRTAAEVFQELHETIGASQFRGYPRRSAQATLKLFEGFVDASEVTWFTAAELGTNRPWLPTGNTSVQRSLRLLFETVDVAARHFGADRVRLIYAFV